MAKYPLQHSARIIVPCRVTRAQPRHVRSYLQYIKPVNLLNSSRHPFLSFVLPFDFNLHIHYLWRLLAI
jgi:hypothetical protein